GYGSALPVYLDNADISLSPVLRQRLEALDFEQLQSTLRDVLSKRQIRALLKRRDRILRRWPSSQYIDKASGTVFN
ncbi:MAG: hypothetical protein KJO35_07840, partial [Gammaproteobacteria bacterium]|nr:hypothetical protein [Gammaproteobacteria bacterium]